MKHFRSLLSFGAALLVLLLAFGLSSCGQSKEKKAEKALVECISKMTYPQPLEGGISLADCTYKDKNLTMVYQVDSKKLDLVNLNKDKYTEGAINKLATRLFTRQLKQLIIDAKASVTCVFQTEDDTTSFTITAAQLEGAQ